MGIGRQVPLDPQSLDSLQHGFTLATVHHAEQVIGPARQVARAAVAEIDPGFRRQHPPDRAGFGIGNIPDHHRVGAIAQRAMPDNDAQALDHILFEPIPQPLQHVPLGQAQRLSQGAIRPADQWQARLQGREQRSVRFTRFDGSRIFSRRPGCHRRDLASAVSQIETQIDVKFFQQR